MSHAVYKFDLGTIGIATIEMPLGAEPVHVARQDGVIMLWAICSTSDEVMKTKRRFVAYGTGHPLDDNIAYVGTLHEKIGTIITNFVLHIFEHKS